MTTTSESVVVGETGINPESDSQTDNSSSDGQSAAEGDNSGSEGEGKFVPLDRFQDVIKQRNSDREELARLKGDQEQLLAWVHQKAVPAIERLDGMGNNQSSDEEPAGYEDPLEMLVNQQATELKQMKSVMEKERNESFSRRFQKRIEMACNDHGLASPAEVIDSYLKNPGESFDYESAAKKSHERNLRKADLHYKKQGQVSKAKKLQDATPAALASKAKPKNIAEARKMARAFFLAKQD
jgi:hypothetical protein